MGCAFQSLHIEAPDFEPVLWPRHVSRETQVPPRTSSRCGAGKLEPGRETVPLRGEVASNHCVIYNAP